MRTRNRAYPALVCALVLASSATAGLAQDTIATRNMRVHTVVPHAVQTPEGADRTLYLAVEESADRPYAYASPSIEGQGFDVYQIGPAADVKLVASTTVGELPPSAASRDIKLFPSSGRTYAALAIQHAESSAGSVAAVIYDLSGDVPKEVTRITQPTGKGFIHLFAYKHSSGNSYLFGTGDQEIHVYDIDRLIARGQQEALVTLIASPEQPVASLKGFRDMFAGYDPDSGQDRLYTAGAGGYYVYNISNPASDSLLASINPAGILYGHKISPIPSGTAVLTAADYRTAPLRYFDLEPAFDGDVPRLRTAVGAWTANWCNFSQQFEMRWPYAFVASMEDGFQMVNLRDHGNPYTTGYVNTSSITTDCDPNAGNRGAYDVEVRNRDGLIVVGDLETGIWFIDAEGFDGWEGHGWGVPHMSSVQDWTNGPDIIGG